jgi:hypothetical protein
MELDDIIAFFNGLGIGSVNAVRMRYAIIKSDNRDTEKKPKIFKGSVFVEWSALDEAKAAAVKPIVCNEVTLLVKTRYYRDVCDPSSPAYTHV